MDAINPDKYNRDQLNALAIELGADEAAVNDATTKADVVALIPAGATVDPNDVAADDTGNADEPNVTVEGLHDPATADREPDPGTGITAAVQTATQADTAPGNTAGYFIVAGHKVDFNGRPIDKG